MKIRAIGRFKFLLLFSLCLSISARADFPVDTPLMEAAGEGDLARVKALVESGADVDEARGDGETALMAAARAGHDTVLAYLIKKGAKVDGGHEYGWTALGRAAAAGRVACVRILIDAGASLRIDDALLAAAIYPLEDESLAPERIQKAIDVVRLLVDAGADIDASHRGDAPLMIAARLGHGRIVDFLIEVGADVDKAREENLSGFGVGKGWTALHFAVRENHVSIAMDLLKTDMSRVHLNDVLAMASEEGLHDIARALIAGGADPRSGNRDGESALMLAANRGRVKIVALLLDAGADPNEDGVLLSGAFSGNIQVVRRLLEAGADVRRFGGEAMGIASRDGHAGIAVELIRAGGDPGWRDRNGNTVLMRYIQGGYTNNIHLLKTAGVDIDARNDKGETALIMAAKMKTSDAARNCLHAGADFRIADSSGKTAMDHAMEKGRLSIIERIADSYKKELLSNRVMMSRAFGRPIRGLKIHPPRMEIPAACILDETPLGLFPGMKGEALVRLKTGAPLLWTGNIQPDASVAGLFHLEAASPGGETGWVPAHALVFHPDIGVVARRTPVRARPSGAADAERWWSVPDIVEITGENGEWLEIRGGEQNLSGWIEKSLVLRGKKEMITAGWALNELSGESSLSRDERMASFLSDAPYPRSRLVKELRNLRARKEKKKITVKTARDFIEAIGSHREILLAPGDYHLDDLKPRSDPYVNVNSSCVNEFVRIRDVEGLKIVGAPGKVPSRLLLRCRFASVLKIENSREVTIRGLVIGHAEGDDDCAGGVLSVYNTSNLAIVDSTLFGSGTYGLRMTKVNGFTFKNSAIEACTSSIMSFYLCGRVHLEESRFFNNDCKNAPVSISGSQGVHIIRCDFRRNTTRGDRKHVTGMVRVQESSDVRILKSSFRENTAGKFLDLSPPKKWCDRKEFPEPLVEGCEFTDNVFRGEKHITR